MNGGEELRAVQIILILHVSAAMTVITMQLITHEERPFKYKPLKCKFFRQMMFQLLQTSEM